eukprot:g1545.t1
MDTDSLGGSAHFDLAQSEPLEGDSFYGRSLVDSRVFCCDAEEARKRLAEQKRRRSMQLERLADPEKVAAEQRARATAKLRADAEMQAVAALQPKPRPGAVEYTPTPTPTPARGRGGGLRGGLSFVEKQEAFIDGRGQRGRHPGIPIFHIIGNITRDPASGNLTYEHINDANGLFQWLGVYHIFHQCCQKHWDHVVSTDLVHWKRLPPPVQPNRTDPAEWYDAKGSFDGSAAILPDLGPVILYDTIGPFSPPTPAPVAGVAAAPPLRDNPGCQGLSWPVNPQDPELTHWRKDAHNPLDFGPDFKCGEFAKNTAGAFPGGIWRSNASGAGAGGSGHVYSYLSFGYRFESSDPSLHEWRKVEPQFLSNTSRMEHNGQWFVRMPGTVDGAPPPAGSPTHLVSCGGGAEFCLGFYDEPRQAWADFVYHPASPTPAPAPAPAPNASLCVGFGRDWDVPGGDYNGHDNATRLDFRGCDADGRCPCQADCLRDATCDAWTVVPGDRCCLKRFPAGWRPDPKARPGTGFITGMRDPTRCARGPPAPGPAPAAAQRAFTDLGPDANWLTAGFLSGGLGATSSSDRLLNIGWITPMNFDPPRKSSGGLTVPREVQFEPRTAPPTLVANPVRELAALRNATLASEPALRLAAGAAHAVPGTGGGAAASSDTEVRFLLPPAAASRFQVTALGGGGPAAAAPAEGVVVTLVVSAPAVDGSRRGLASIGDAGAAKPARSGAFAMLPGEAELTLRVLTDRVVVEAFVQGGRAVFTRSFVPSSAAHSAVYVAANTTANVAVDVWSMGCGWVGADEEYRPSPGLASVVYNVPASCLGATCGLVVDAHGWTLDADIEDAGDTMRALGEDHGYIVLQPVAMSGWPNGTGVHRPDWDQNKCQDLEDCPGDGAAYALVQEAFARTDWRVDRQRVHFMGFSAGGMMSARMLCKYGSTGTFQSFAMIESWGAALNSPPARPTRTALLSCLQDHPSLPMPPILVQNGRVNNPYSADARAQLALAGAVKAWGLRNRTVIAGDGNVWTRTRWSAPSGNPLEFINHSYVTDGGLGLMNNGLNASGHCFVGSVTSALFGCPGPVQRATGRSAGYAIGVEAVKFFLANERN